MNATAPWVRFQDPGTGHGFLYNMDTGESKWDVSKAKIDPNSILDVEKDEKPEEHGDDSEDLWLEWENVYDEVFIEISDQKSSVFSFSELCFLNRHST